MYLSFIMSSDGILLNSDLQENEILIIKVIRLNYWSQGKQFFTFPETLGVYFWVWFCSKLQKKY